MNFIHNSDSSGWSSRRRAGFDHRSVHTKFVVGKVALGQAFFSENFSFPVSISFHQRSIIIFTYTLLLPQTEIDGTGEFPPKRKALSETEVHGKEKDCHLVFLGLGSASVATISHVRASAIIFLPIAGNQQTFTGKKVDAKFRENRLIC